MPLPRKDPIAVSPADRANDASAMGTLLDKGRDSSERGLFVARPRDEHLACLRPQRRLPAWRKGAGHRAGASRRPDDAPAAIPRWRSFACGTSRGLAPPQRRGSGSRCTHRRGILTRYQRAFDVLGPSFGRLGTGLQVLTSAACAAAAAVHVQRPGQSQQERKTAVETAVE